MTKLVTLKLGPPGATPEGVAGDWLKGEGASLGCGIWVGRPLCTWPGVGGGGAGIDTGAANAVVDRAQTATKAAAKRGALPFTNPSPNISD
jgi:hypothetical protein